MPIFEKDNRRIYFAHVPKTAGSAVYVLFARAGWTILNLATGFGKRRIGRQLRDECGLSSFPTVGDTSGIPWSIQHATAQYWTRWGPFDASFAITRNPWARYRSGLAYHYGARRQSVSFDTFRQAEMARLASRMHRPEEVPAMFLPQHLFHAPETELFSFEDVWAASVSRRFGIGAEAVERVNPSRRAPFELTADERDFVAEFYAEDVERLGYAQDGARAQKPVAPLDPSNAVREECRTLGETP